MRTNLNYFLIKLFHLIKDFMLERYESFLIVPFLFKDTFNFVDHIVTSP